MNYVILKKLRLNDISDEFLNLHGINEESGNICRKKLSHYLDQKGMILKYSGNSVKHINILAEYHILTSPVFVPQVFLNPLKKVNLLIPVQ